MGTNIQLENSAIHQYRFYLCKPNRQTIAELHAIKNIKLIENYGGINELQFAVSYQLATTEGEQIRNPIIDQIRGDYLIRYEFRNEVKDYFVIANPENTASEDGSEMLVVLCYQLHYEWRNKLIRRFTGVLPLYDPVGSNGVLNQTLLSKTDWTIDYVDSSLFTPTHKHRTFDESEKNLLEFVFQAIEAYGSYIPVIDTVNKRLSIYLDSNYGMDHGLTIENGKYLKSLKEVEKFDEVITRLFVYGKDNLSINAMNPGGTDYLESFDFYMHPFAQDEHGNVTSHSHYISDELCQAIISYNRLVASKTSEFTNMLAQRTSMRETLLQQQNLLTNLKTDLQKLLDQKDVLIGTNGSLDTINGSIANKHAEIDHQISQINAVLTSISFIDTQINTLKTTLAIESNFTADQIKERNQFIKEKVWQDTNYFEAEALYAQGKENLLLWSQPNVSYEISSVDFLNALNVTYDKGRLKLGSVVTIRYPKFHIDIKAKIIVIDHDISGNSLNLTIANTKDIKSGFLKIKDLLSRSVSTSSQVDMSRFKWDLSESNHTEINHILNNEWSANRNAIVGGSALQYELNSRGLTISSPTDPMKFLRAVNSTISITSDGGNTYKNALTYQGVVAERLFGVVIAGANLTIQNDAGTVSIDGNGMTVTDMDLVITKTDLKNRLMMNATDGFRIQRNTGTTANPNWSDQISLDAQGNAVFSGKVRIGSGNSMFTADDQGIYLGSSNFNSAPFSVSPQGYLKATNSVVTGTINATGGTFSGNITANGTITGGVLSGSYISGGSINGGIIYGGSIYGSYISTNQFGYPRAEISNTYNSFGVYSSANSHIVMTAAPGANNTPYLTFTSGGTQSNITHVDGAGLMISNGSGQGVWITANRIPMNGEVSVPSWGHLSAGGISLAYELNQLKSSNTTLTNRVNDLNTSLISVSNRVRVLENRP
ncbi:hypothetical protein EBB07_06025 [Paenibacillaceae bacterium]|nr:hypothetical protein EBB07_06025 [Paenibacillaceae bacterium]